MPLDMNTLRAMKRSSLGLDLYLWTAPNLLIEAPTAARNEELNRLSDGD